MQTDFKVKLRPLNILEVIDQAVRLYRRHFFKFIAIIAVVMVPTAILSLVLGIFTGQGALEILSAQGSYEDFLSDFGPRFFMTMLVSVVLGIVSWLFSQLSSAATVRAVADAYLGQSQGVGDTFRVAVKSWGRLLLISFVLAVLLFGYSTVVVVLMIIPCLGWLAAGLLSGPLIFLTLVLLPLLASVVVLEKQSLWGSLRRVWDLVRPRFWAAIGFAAVFYVLSLFFVAGPSMLISFGSQFLIDNLTAVFGGLDATVVLAIVQSLVSLVTGLIYTPLQLIGVVLFYFDLRVRGEGLDLALSAEQSLEDAVDPLVVLAQAPEPSSAPLLTGKDWGHFGLLSLGATVIIFGVMLVIVFLSMLPLLLL